MKPVELEKWTPDSNEFLVSPKLYQRLLDAMAKGFKPPTGISSSTELMFYLNEFERSSDD